MLGRMQRMGALLGAHSSEESSSEEESGAENIYGDDQLEESDSSASSVDDQEEEDGNASEMSDQKEIISKPQLEPVPEYSHHAIMQYTDSAAGYVCAFCPGKTLPKKEQVELHIASKSHKRRLHQAKRQAMPPEKVDKLKAKAEERRLRRQSRKQEKALKRKKTANQSPEATTANQSPEIAAANDNPDATAVNHKPAHAKKNENRKMLRAHRSDKGDKTQSDSAAAQPVNAVPVSAPKGSLTTKDKPAKKKKRTGLGKEQ